MATGGGGGHVLAEAQVVIHLNDRPMRTAMAKTQSQVAAFASTVGKSLSKFKFSGFTSRRFDVATTAMNRLGMAANAAAIAISGISQSMNKIRVPRNAKAIEGYFQRIQGAFNSVNAGHANHWFDTVTRRVDALRPKLQAIAKQAVLLSNALGGSPAKHHATILKAQAVARGTIMRAQAAASAALIRAEGRNVEGRIKAIGKVITGTIRSIGSAVAAPIRAVTHALTAPLRMLGSLRTLILGGLIGAGSGFGVGAVTGQAMAMESREVALRRITGETNPGRFGSLLGDLKTTASQMAGTKLEDVFGLAQFGAKLGLGSNQLRLFTRDLVRVKTVLEDLGIEDAATQMARMMEVFDVGKEKTIGLASALVRLDNASTASGAHILNVATRLSGVFSTFKGSAEQALALATGLREAGIPIETGGTAVGQIIQRMASSKDMPNFAKLAGMRRGPFEQLLGSNPFQALIEVEKGLKNLGDTQGPVAASRALEKLHLDGQRVRSTMLQLSKVIDRLAYFEDIATEEMRTHAAVMEGFDMQSKTTAAQVQRMKNNLALLAAEAGRALLPIVKGLAEGFRLLSVDLQRFFEANRGRFEAWGQQIGKFAEWIGLFFRNFSDFAQLGKHVGAVLLTDITTALMSAAKKFGGFLFGELKFIFLEALPKVIMNLGRDLGSMLMQLFSSTVARLGEEIHNVLENMPFFGTGNVIPPNQMTPIGFKAGTFGNPLRGVNGANSPFLGGITNFINDALKNRAGHVTAIGGILGKLGGAFKQQHAENVRGVAFEGLRDAVGRSAAGLGIGGEEGGTPFGRFGAGFLSFLRQENLPQPRRRFSPVREMARMQVMGLHEQARRQAMMVRGLSPRREAPVEREPRIDPKLKFMADVVKEVGKNIVESINKAGKGPVGNVLGFFGIDGD